MRREGRVHRGGGRSITGRWSHLLADDPDELADVRRRASDSDRSGSRQPGTPREHYDVVEHLRRRAIAAGAVPISYPHGTGNLIATKRLQASALDAAGRGWHVFPLRPGTKVPAVRHWEHEATTDTEQIKELWSAELRRRDGWYVPEPRNVGIACGPSGLVVLDLDLAKPGQDRTRWPVQWRDHDVCVRRGRARRPGRAGRAERARDLRRRHSLRRSAPVLRRARWTCPCATPPAVSGR